MKAPQAPRQLLNLTAVLAVVAATLTAPSASARWNNDDDDRRDRRGGLFNRGAQSEEERDRMATFCSHTLGLTIPAVTDTMDDATSSDYDGWPERLFLISTDGLVAYRGGPGPMGFDPDGFEQAIRAHLSDL